MFSDDDDNDDDDDDSYHYILSFFKCINSFNPHNLIREGW